MLKAVFTIKGVGIVALLSSFFVIFCVQAADWEPEPSVDVSPRKWPNLKNGDLSVRSDHPYLFIDPELAYEIGGKKEELRRLQSYVYKKYKLQKLSQSTIRSDVTRQLEKLNHISKYMQMAMWLGMNAYLNDDALTKKYARQFALAIMDLPSLTYPAVLLNQDAMAKNKKTKPKWENGVAPDDAHPRGKVFALGVIYDWVYDSLTESDKRAMRAEIIRQLEYQDSSRLNSWKSFSYPIFTGGHSRFANISALTGLLAIYHDAQNDSKIKDKYNYYLEKVVNNFESGYNPVLAWVSKNGGSEKGWAYGTSYSSLGASLVWEYATNEKSWLDDIGRDQHFFYMYGTRNTNSFSEYKKGGYHNYPYSGDVWGTYYKRGEQGVHMLIAANKYGDGHAQKMYREMPETDSYWHILYSKAEQTKEASLYELPLSRHFYNSGYVVIRDSWSSLRNTLTVFKSTSFSSYNHHHRDQNAFTIYYKGPLAIDSGGYSVFGGYGSKHAKNYYTRTVAHNTILVYDPNEKFMYGSSERLSNDGGQIITGDSYPELGDMKPGGISHLDGIVRYQEHDDFTYTMGDATKAYRSNKVSLFKRQLISLRNHSYRHPVVLVYDQVVSTDPSFKKTYLLHSIDKPEKSGKYVKVTVNDGMKSSNSAHLYQQTLLPLNPKMELVGGSGKEFLVHDDGYGKAHNYNEGQRSKGALPLKESGQWRVEVSPSKEQLSDQFLHVLTVTDGGQSRQKATYIASAKYDAAWIKDRDGQEITLVVFAKNPESPNDSISFTDNLVYKKLLMVGLDPNTNFTITQEVGRIVIKRDKMGQHTTSSEGIIYLDSK